MIGLKIIIHGSSLFVVLNIQWFGKMHNLICRSLKTIFIYAQISLYFNHGSQMHSRSHFTTIYPSSLLAEVKFPTFKRIFALCLFWSDARTYKRQMATTPKFDSTGLLNTGTVTNKRHFNPLQRQCLKTPSTNFYIKRNCLTGNELITIFNNF